MRLNFLSRWACGLIVALMAIETPAGTLILDEVEVMATLPEFDHTTFFRAKPLTSAEWLPKVLASSDRTELINLRNRLDAELTNCLVDGRCRVASGDLEAVQAWIKKLQQGDDPRAQLQVGLLRGSWLVATYMADLKRQGQEKPKLNVQDAIRFLSAQFTKSRDPLLQAGILYAQAKIALWGKDLNGAIEALMFVERIDESTLTPELFAWLGALEEARGRLEVAGKYYSRVRHGEYLAPSLVGIARSARHLGQCQETLRVGARFQTRVASREERDRYLPELLREEAICEALIVGAKLVDELDGVNAPAVHKLAQEITKARARLSAKEVITKDLIACYNIQFPELFRNEALDLTLAGTAGDLELSQSNDNGLYGSNTISALESCMQRRLAGGLISWRFEGEVRIVPQR